MHLAQDEPSAWVSRFAARVPAGLVLDLACGGGRHARLFAGLGHAVLAVDRSASAIEQTQDAAITGLCFDLEQDGAEAEADWPLLPGRFAGIVVTNYLHRPLFTPLLQSLASGGVLIYETFALENGRFGKPSNPDFLLAPGELLDIARSEPGLRVLAFEDGYAALPKPSMIQRLCLIKSATAVEFDPMQLAL
jgi:SAM-dependent methyltransferase